MVACDSGSRRVQTPPHSPARPSSSTMYLMYTLDADGKRVYTLQAR